MMKNRSKSLFLLTIAGLLSTAVSVKASSPDSWEQHDQEVTAECINVSGLRNAEAAGEIVRYGDEIGYDALLVRGNYPQPHMNNQVGQVLCLFNRETRQAVVSDADRLAGETVSSGRSQ